MGCQKRYINAIYILLALTLIAINPSNAQTIKLDTISIYYDIDISNISTDGLLQIDKAAQLLNKKNSNCDIIGYADFLASNSYNKTLSLKRATIVNSYLLNKGAKTTQIKKCEGRGEQTPSVTQTAKGEPQSRRVDIVIRSMVHVKAAKAETEVLQQQSLNIENMNSLEVGQTLVLENMYFFPGRHFLRNTSTPTLLKLLNIMQQNPTLCIEIQGHICCWNEPGDGLDIDTNESKLSENRAKHIYNYLIENKIDASRLSYKGFARTKPLVEIEKTVADANKNRRVEIMITKK